jgi:hypothetical protein
MKGNGTFMLQYFYREREMPLYPMGVSLGGPQCRFGRFEKQKYFLPLAEREIQFPSHCVTEIPPLSYTVK